MERVPSPPRAPPLITLIRNGYDNVELNIDQVTPSAVARIFLLNVDTLWLREAGGGSAAFFPDVLNERFDFTPEVGVFIMEFIVEGSTRPIADRTRASSSSAATRVLSVPSNPPPACKKTTGSSQFANVKLILASMKNSKSGKPSFRKLHQNWVKVVEATANVHYITHAARDLWGENLVLVTADGMRLEDSSGTQGLEFWRVGSRKVFAVTEKNLRCVSKGKFPADTSTSSDSDFESKPRSKYLKSSDIGKDIKDIKVSLSNLFKVEKSTPVPMALRHMLSETFKCSICQDIITPPAIFSRCCKYMIGCEKCVDCWYESNGNERSNKTCPRCRADRGFTETCRINGIDEFLLSVKPVLDQNTV